MLALQRLRSKSIECRTVPQHHTPTIASSYASSTSAVSLVTGHNRPRSSHASDPLSRAGMRGAALPPPLPATPSLSSSESPPTEVLHHPPTTQRRSARPHAHHSLSSAQPPSRPPRGSDIINRTTLYSFLLPVFYYSTSSAPPASSASSSPSDITNAPRRQRRHDTPLKRKRELAEAAAALFTPEQRKQLCVREGVSGRELRRYAEAVKENEQRLMRSCYVRHSARLQVSHRARSAAR